jgi:hypothetical protein
MIKKSVKQLVEIELAGKTEVLGIYPPKFHFDNRKFNMA